MTDEQRAHVRALVHECNQVLKDDKAARSLNLDEEQYEMVMSRRRARMIELADDLVELFEGEDT